MKTLWNERSLNFSDLGSRDRGFAGSQDFPATQRTSDPAIQMVVFTGGEPTLQITDELITALKREGFYVAIETNGTKSVPNNIDWITVSPKIDSEIVQNKGDELKLVYPQKGLDPKTYLDLNFKHFYLQPKDSSDQKENTQLCIDYCLDNPTWKLSIQLHKVLKIK